MRKTINIALQAWENREKGYFLMPSSLLVADKDSAREFAEAMLDACDKAEQYRKDYVVEVTKKGTLYSAPWYGEDTSGVVIFTVKHKDKNN